MSLEKLIISFKQEHEENNGTVSPDLRRDFLKHADLYLEDETLAETLL